jgi:ribosome-associated protein
MATTETRRMVLAAAAACEDKKAEDTRILELDPMDSGFTDFFLITSGANERQTQAIADEIEVRLKREFHTYPNSVEGRRQGEWVLMDYVDFVVHIFLAEKRAFYDIERLRKSARIIDPAQLSTLAQLKTTLKEKTAAARAKKAPGKAAQAAPAAVKRKPAKKGIGKKEAAKKASAVKKPAIKKSAARKRSS